MRSELYDALRAATEGEFELLGELDRDGGWIAYLAAAGADDALAILLLHRTPDGQEFELQVARALDGSLVVGKTTCSACGTTGDGWPRFCAGCARDLSGVAADAAVPGGSPAELLEAVRQASDGVYDVLGAMQHAEGGGAMYFATEEDGRIVGLVLEREADGELCLVRSWAYDQEALAADASSAAAWPEAATAPAPPAAVEFEPVAEAEPEPGADPVLVEGVPAAAALLLDPEPRPARRTGLRAPSRRVLYGAAGALLVAAGLVLAFVVVQRDSSATPPLATRTDTDTAAPAPPPALPVSAFTDSPTVATPASEPTTRSPIRPTTPPPPPVVVVEPPPAPEGPTPDQDRQAALAAVRRYASAVESRRMDRLRAAYPGMSEEETARWTEWFSHFGGGEALSVSYAVSQGPVLEGDVATMTFTLTMRYQGQLQRVTSRATLRRDGSRWELQALNTPQ